MHIVVFVTSSSMFLHFYNAYSNCSYRGTMNYDDADVNDLLRSSLEVSSALDSFMREREDAATAQQTALKAYESEMLHIMAESIPEENIE